jgi:DNA processing protein
MAADNLLDLMICRIPALKPKERADLARKFSREDDFTVLSKADIEVLLGKILKGPFWTVEEFRKQAEKDLMRSQKLGIKLVYWRDSDNAYPPLLREIPDPPLVLYYRGILPDPEKALVAVVGTRKPSSQARVRAFELGREFGKAGFPVVSGLALGIDAMAHKGNIEAGAPTVAVLGSSPDMVYPHSNRDLARRILETGGLILSEYPPETGPFKWNFPARNRIISGMSRGTVVVEAPEKSGALITAGFARDEGRDLWMDAVGLKSKRGGGMAKVVEDGAMVLSSVHDILAEWNIPETPGFQGDAGKSRESCDDAQNDGANLAASFAKEFDIKL